MTNFGAFWNFTDVRFATFSVLTGVSFGKNEISTDVVFWAFFWGKTGQGEKEKKKKTHALAKFWKFWEFLRFFLLLWFPLERCLLVQSAFSAALVG